MIGNDDLQWWLDKVDTLEWTWAKTYADSAPHHYVVLGRTEGMTKDDFIRAGKVIRMFGEPGRFYSMVGIYLTHNGRKWWTMDPLVEDTDLINMADTKEVYGKQDLPSTKPKGEVTELTNLYDNLGPGYDKLWQSPSDKEEDTAIKRMVAKHFGAYAPSTLDVGCGTGLLLDLGITSPKMYTGIDPSQGMLNELILKHPDADVTAARGEDVDWSMQGKYDLVVALFAAASYLTPETIEELPKHANSLLIGMCYEPGYFPDYYDEDNPPPVELTTKAHEAWMNLARAYGGKVIKIGRFDVVVVEK